MLQSKMNFVDPVKTFDGVVLIAAPHMDDEVLACGGTVAGLPQKERIHIAYATDGTKSPVPLVPWLGSPTVDLAKMRVEESQKATSILGIPPDNVHYLALPDGKLKQHKNELRVSMSALIADLEPDFIFVPFRYDRHPDHLTLRRALLESASGTNCETNIIEYFVYHRYRLLPRKDIREYIDPRHLIGVDIRDHANEKMKALQCFKSQTTTIFQWQNRPILPKERIQEVSSSPELFIRYSPDHPGDSIFKASGAWIRFVHAIEPYLKTKKEQILSITHLGRIRNDNRKD
jgi:LmbE family N-acetylglucosaminyl deacetylase